MTKHSKRLFTLLLFALLATFLLISTNAQNPPGQDTADEEDSGNWIRRDGDGATVGVAPAPHQTAHERKKQVPTKQAVSTAMTPVEEQIFRLTNQFRQQNRLPALLPETVLVATARAHSLDMQLRGYFSHVNPDGEDSDRRIAQAHRSLVGSHGENIWRGRGYNTQDAEKVGRLIVDSWIESPQHRRNMLRPEYTHLGIGIAAERGEIYATQNFSEVWAYLEKPFPLSVRNTALETGRFPGTAARSYGQREKASFYDVRGSRGQSVTKPVPIGESPPTALRRGPYRLYFHFLESESQGRRNYSVVTGPLFQIE